MRRLILALILAASLQAQDIPTFGCWTVMRPYCLLNHPEQLIPNWKICTEITYASEGL